MKLTPAFCQYYFAKKLQKQTLSAEKLLKTLSLKKAACKM